MHGLRVDTGTIKRIIRWLMEEWIFWIRKAVKAPTEAAQPLYSRTLKNIHSSSPSRMRKD